MYVQEQPQLSGQRCFAQVNIRIQLSGIPGDPVDVSFLGDGPDLRSAVAVPGCEWGHTFLPVLLQGIGRPDLCAGDPTGIEIFEGRLAGRPATVYAAHLDRELGAPAAEPPQDVVGLRSADAGGSALIRLVLAEAPHAAGPLLVSISVGHTPWPTFEVRSSAGPCPQAEEALARRFPPREDGRMLFLRELAVVVPQP